MELPRAKINHNDIENARVELVLKLTNDGYTWFSIYNNKTENTEVGGDTVEMAKKNAELTWGAACWDLEWIEEPTETQFYINLDARVGDTVICTPAEWEEATANIDESIEAIQYEEFGNPEEFLDLLTDKEIWKGEIDRKKYKWLKSLSGSELIPDSYYAAVDAKIAAEDAE